MCLNDDFERPTGLGRLADLAGQYVHSTEGACCVRTRDFALCICEQLRLTARLDGLPLSYNFGRIHADA